MWARTKQNKKSKTNQIRISFLFTGKEIKPKFKPKIYSSRLGSKVTTRTHILGLNFETKIEIENQTFEFIC